MLLHESPARCGPSVAFSPVAFVTQLLPSVEVHVAVTRLALNVRLSVRSIKVLTHLPYLLYTLASYPLARHFYPYSRSLSSAPGAEPFAFPSWSMHSLPCAIANSRHAWRRVPDWRWCEFFAHVAGWPHHEMITEKRRLLYNGDYIYSNVQMGRKS